MARKPSRKKRTGFRLCRDYLGFGIGSLATGALFLALTIVTTVNLVKIFVIGFFILLGIIDLTLYYFFREK